MFQSQWYHKRAQASIGGGGVRGAGGRTRPPLFSVGESIGIDPPLFSSENCGAYSLTHHSSLLKAATIVARQYIRDMMFPPPIRKSTR